MLLFGQCLAVFNSKYVLMSAITFFMLGSCISGAAINIETLIIGRAFAGIGAAGCWVCVQTFVAMLVEDGVSCWFCPLELSRYS
jgi:predicted MFS family arabinose efflux permease